MPGQHFSKLHRLGNINVHGLGRENSRNDRPSEVAHRRSPLPRHLFGVRGAQLGMFRASGAGERRKRWSTPSSLQVLLVLFSRHYIVTIGALSLLLAGSDQEGTAVLTSQPLCQPPAAGLVLQAAGQADWKSRPEVGRTQMQTAWVIRYIANFTCSWTTFCRLQCSYMQALCSRGHAPFQPTAYAGYSHTCRCRSAEDPKTVVRFNRNYCQLSSEKFSYGPALNVVGLHMSRGDRSRHRAQ